MAITACGKGFSWDSPMWCSGKKQDSVKGKDSKKVEPICMACPWYIGNKKDDYE